MKAAYPQTSEKPEIVLVSVQGNIGSGKSTIMGPLLKELKNDPSIREYFQSICYVPEPVDHWMKPFKYDNDIKESYKVGYLKRVEKSQRALGVAAAPAEDIFDFNDDTKTPLGTYYKDQSKEAFPFQIHAFSSRMSSVNAVIENAIRTNESKAPISMGKKVEEVLKMKPKPILLISERSIFCDRNVFMLANVEGGYIKPDHAAIYDEIYRTLLYNSYYLEKAMIYVTTQTEKCHDRIMIRSRKAESEVELDYLKSLDNYHEKMIREFNGDVLKLKNNRSLEQTVISIKSLMVDLKKILIKEG